NSRPGSRTSGEAAVPNLMERCSFFSPVHHSNVNVYVIAMRLALTVAALILVLCVSAAAQQMVDPEFKAVVPEPAFTKNFPRVLFDEGHNNLLTRNGRYKPFVDLIVMDGYQVVVSRKLFNKETLDTFTLLVVSNALGAEDVDDAG